MTKDTDQLGKKSSDASSAVSTPYRGLDIEQPDQSEVLPSVTPRWFLLLAAFLMLCSATFDTTSTKAANRVNLPPCDGCEPKFFEAPMLQTWIGYLGQLIFLPIYFIDEFFARRNNRARKLDLPTSPSDFKKPHCPVWIWIFPLLLDFISTSCLNYSTMLAQASTVQMLRSSNIILAFLLSAFVLKNRLYVHQIFGVLLIFLGLVLVAVYAMTNPDQSTNYNSLQWVGIVTALGGTCFSALQWVMEEAIFRRYYCSPFEGVGWMGFYGVIIGGAALGICQAAGFEDVKGAFYMMGLGEHGSTILLIMNIGYIFSLAINTASGITVTKLASSLLRTIVNAGRTVSIWVIELIIGWSTFATLNFIGLIVIIIAMCVYNYNYFTDKEGHWPGDRLLRKPAACLPNKHEVTKRGGNTDGFTSAERKDGNDLRRRKNSIAADNDSIVAKSERSRRPSTTAKADIELGTATAA